LSERQLSDSIFDSVYAENLQPGGRARDVLMGGGTAAEERFYRVVLPNGMYYLSGLYEFTLLWDRPDAQPFGWGALHFYPVVRVAQLLDPTFLENVDEVEYVYREGVWQTFFGPLWIDFGWFGVMLMIPVGACMATLATRARNRDLPYLPLYLYGLVIIFFMPVVNLLTSGFGLFTIAAFAAFVPIAKAYSRPLAQRPESNGPVQRAVGQS
jgi:hypothetical protein